MSLLRELRRGTLRGAALALLLAPTYAVLTTPAFVALLSCCGIWVAITPLEAWLGARGPLSGRTVLPVLAVGWLLALGLVAWFEVQHGYLVMLDVSASPAQALASIGLPRPSEEQLVALVYLGSLLSYHTAVQLEVRRREAGDPPRPGSSALGWQVLAVHVAVGGLVLVVLGIMSLGQGLASGRLRHGLFRVLALSFGGLFALGAVTITVGTSAAVLFGVTSSVDVLEARLWPPERRRSRVTIGSADG